MRTLLWLASLNAYAVPNYLAERDPQAPVAKKQYRLILRTPGRACDTWHKVDPQIAKEDLLVSSSKKDEEGRGCRFLWVITPAEIPGPITFTLEGHTGPKETFELPAPPNFQPPKPAEISNSPFLRVPGIADENGNGPTVAPPKANLNTGTGR